MKSGVLLKSVVAYIKKYFSVRIISLVGYGSYIFMRAKENSDIDLCLLLDSRKDNDLVYLHNVIKKHNYKIDITVHYLDEIESRGWEHFYHGTHGVFFLHHLASAELLLGDDIFARKAQQVPLNAYNESIFAQINQYIDRIQVNLTQCATIDVGYYRKYILRVMTDMLLLSSDISYREINRSSGVNLMNNYINKSKLFSAKTKELLKTIMSNKNADKKSIILAVNSLVKDFYKQIKVIDNEKCVNC